MIRLIKRCGFKERAVVLSGDVENGLKSSCFIVDNHIKGYSIVRMNYRRDFAEVMKKELRSYRTEPSNLTNYSTADKSWLESQTKKFLKKMCDDKAVFLLKKKNKLIGAIGTLFGERKGQARILLMINHCLKSYSLLIG